MMGIIWFIVGVNAGVLIMAFMRAVKESEGE